MAVYGLSCCGIKEYAGLSSYLSYKHKGDIEKAVRGMLKELAPGEGVRPIAAFCVFSTVTSKDLEKECDGAKVAAFIVKNDLGTVMSSDLRRNPNSGNTLKMWVWELSPTGISNFLKGVKKVRRVRKVIRKVKEE